jgi:hypothetical protein
MGVRVLDVSAGSRLRISPAKPTSPSNPNHPQFLSSRSDAEALGAAVELGLVDGLEDPVVV